MVKVAFRKSILSRSSRARCMRRDEEGVASVIGTIMALLIFMTFMTMFVNTYIPIWMKENERLHMNEVQDQMGEVKGKIDNLIVNAQVTGTSMVNTYEPITMGADGIPLFASATAGAVILKPTGTSTTGIHVMFNNTANGITNKVDQTGGGKLEFYAPNRYYVGQWLAYENGALIVKQDVGETMKAPPSLEITKSGGNFNIVFTQIDVYGTNSTMAGTGVAGVNINLIYLDTQKYTEPSGQNTTVLKINTVYNVAFMDFLNKTMLSVDPIKADYLYTPWTNGKVVGSVCTVTAVKNSVNEFKVTDTVMADNSHMIVLQVYNTGTMTLSRAFVQVDINV
jgi:hypothetical protein